MIANFLFPNTSFSFFIETRNYDVSFLNEERKAQERYKESQKDSEGKIYFTSVNSNSSIFVVNGRIFLKHLRKRNDEIDLIFLEIGEIVLVVSYTRFRHRSWSLS